MEVFEVQALRSKWKIPWDAAAARRWPITFRRFARNSLGGGYGRPEDWRVETQWFSSRVIRFWRITPPVRRCPNRHKFPATCVRFKLQLTPLNRCIFRVPKNCQVPSDCVTVKLLYYSLKMGETGGIFPNICWKEQNLHNCTRHGQNMKKFSKYSFKMGQPGIIFRNMR